MYELTIDSNAVGNIMLSLEWNPNNASMDDSSNPNTGNWTLLVDGVPRAIGNMDNNIGSITTIYAGGAAAVTSFEVRLDSYDLNMLNTDGIHALPGQSISVDVP